MSNIKRARELGYNIDITSCISKGMIKRDENNELYLHRMIKLAENLGIEKIQKKKQEETKKLTFKDF